MHIFYRMLSLTTMYCFIYGIIQNHYWKFVPVIYMYRLFMSTLGFNAAVISLWKN